MGHLKPKPSFVSIPLNCPLSRFLHGSPIHPHLQKSQHPKTSLPHNSEQNHHTKPEKIVQKIVQKTKNVHPTRVARPRGYPLIGKCRLSAYTRGSNSIIVRFCARDPTTQRTRETPTHGPTHYSTRVTRKRPPRTYARTRHSHTRTSPRTTHARVRARRTPKHGCRSEKTPSPKQQNPVDSLAASGSPASSLLWLSGR